MFAFAALKISTFHITKCTDMLPSWYETFLGSEMINAAYLQDLQLLLLLLPFKQRGKHLCCVSLASYARFESRARTRSLFTKVATVTTP